MADNFLYQVKNYGGKVLIANRTYYLNRSQPPFLTQMILGVYEKTHDTHYLAEALPEIETYYKLWTTEPHLTPETGLARYWDFGEGPAPEVVSPERNAQGQTHYDLVKALFQNASDQWDAPFGWAPLHMIAVDGLRRYGFKADADRIAIKWLSLIHRDFIHRGYIVEKYDVVHASSNVESQIHFGYSANQAGFGRTNAVFIHLYDELSPVDQQKVLAAR